MSRKIFRRLSIAVALVALSPLLLLFHPRARAVTRLVTGFVESTEDQRVFYEPGAEEFAADIAAALPEAVAAVERAHSLPFRRDFRVYVCASHESFMNHIHQPVSFPVRGIAFLWDVWISPKAFAFEGKDTHRQSLAHELSHLHAGQHLNWWRRHRNTPTWFAEGLADWTADTGYLRTTRAEAIAAILAGHQLHPDSEGKVPIPKRPPDYGLTWPMFHAQSRMFIEYLAERRGDAFPVFVQSVLRGETFAEAFEKHLGTTVIDAWTDFVVGLEHDSSETAPAPMVYLID